MDAPVSPVETPVEPDASACMTQTAVDPMRVLGITPETQHYAALANTLVYSNEKGRKMTKSTVASASSHGDYERLTPVIGFYAGQGNPAERLDVYGVAFDGIASPELARMHPNKCGRLVVQITGTTTIPVHPSDLANLQNMDLLCLTGEAHNGGILGYPSITLPKIEKYRTDTEAYMVRQLLAVAENTGDGNYPVDPFTYAAAFCCLFRDVHDSLLQLSIKWMSDFDKILIKDRPLSYYTETTILTDRVNESKEAINTVAGSFTENNIKLARLVASVCRGSKQLQFVYDLLSNYGIVPKNLDIQTFCEHLRRHYSPNPPFALLLERGHNQARILLKPGGTV